MPASVEVLLKHDRQVVAAALVLVIALSWGYTLAGAGMGFSAWEMTAMYSADGPAMDMGWRWSLGYAALMFAMWWLMMVAMMLPSAAPVILLAAALNRRSTPDRAPFGATACFVTGYLLVWAAFSVAAVTGQWGLQEAGLLSSMMRLHAEQAAGGLLLAAALWQLTPFKQACLRECRSPVRLLTQRRRSGNTGAIAIGLEHGAYCLGCCWVLMALLFVGGAMNLYWISGLALFVLVEKTLSAGPRIGRVAAARAAVWGLALIAGAA
jgi:predicted metal-binding membrane protein